MAAKTPKKVKQVERNAANEAHKGEMLIKEKDKVALKESKQKVKLKDISVTKKGKKDNNREDQVDRMSVEEGMHTEIKMNEADDKTHRVEDKSTMSADKEESKQPKCEELGNMNRAVVAPVENKVHVIEDQMESGKELKDVVMEPVYTKSGDDTEKCVDIVFCVKDSTRKKY